MDELADIVSFIPNPEFDWEEWKSIAMRIFAASGGKGFKVFQHGLRSAPNMIGKRPQRNSNAGREVKGRRRAAPVSRSYGQDGARDGWVPGLYAHATYPSEGGVITKAQRKLARKIVRDFLHSLVEPEKYRNPWLDGYSEWLDQNTTAWRVKNHIDYLQRKGQKVPPDLAFHLGATYGSGIR